MTRSTRERAGLLRLLVMGGPVDTGQSMGEPSGATQLDVALQRLRDEAGSAEVETATARFGSAF
jgi:hypothetical protein